MVSLCLLFGIVAFLSASSSFLPKIPSLIFDRKEAERGETADRVGAKHWAEAEPLTFNEVLGSPEIRNSLGIDAEGPALNPTPRVRRTSRTVMGFVATTIKHVVGKCIPFSLIPPYFRGSDRSEFTGCSEFQKQVIEFTRGNALSGARYAVEHLNYMGMDGFYKNWFGAPHRRRLALVKSRYEDIIRVLPTMKFDCTCTEESYGHTFSDHPTVIYLCESFWSTSQCGADSKQGTLIHEASHASSKTQDHVYGIYEALLFALRHPELAPDNADSIQYYEEQVFKGCASF